MSSGAASNSTAQRKKKWGEKTAWAKQFFTLVAAGATATGGSALSVGSSSSSAASSSPSPTAEVVSTAGMNKKQLQRLALDPATRWRCRRCGRELLLPVDLVTGRPRTALLADHLEKGSSGSGDAPYVAGTAVPVCMEGPLLFRGDDAAGCEVGGSNSGGTAVMGTADGQAVTTTQAEKRQRLEGDVAIEEEEERALLNLFLPHAATHPPQHQGQRAHANGGNKVEEDAPTSPPPSVFIVVENPKTPANLGSILRAMGCMCGPRCSAGGDGRPPRCQDNSRIGGFVYTGNRLAKAQEEQRRRQGEQQQQPSPPAPAAAAAVAIAGGVGDAVGSTDAQNAGKNIPQLRLRSLHTLFRVLRRLEGAAEAAQKIHARTVAVDLIVGAQALPTYRHPHAAAAAPTTPHCNTDNNTNNKEKTDEDATETGVLRCPRLVLYLFGPEDGSLSPEFLAQCDEAVFMPTVGSLNLAAAVNVLLYDRVAKDYAHYSRVEEGSADRPARNDNLRETTTTTAAATAAASAARGDEGRKRSRGGGDGDEGSSADSLYFTRRNTNNHLRWGGGKDGNTAPSGQQ